MGEYEGGSINPAKTHKTSKYLVFHTFLLRLTVIITSIIVIAVMVNAKQTRHISVLTLKAEWKDSKAFLALVILSAISLGYSFLQSILALFSLASRSTSCAWINFIADQLLTYALLGAAAASAQVAYIAKHGSSSARWNEVCSQFNTFCTRAGAAIILSFISVLALAISSAISAYHLFKHRV